MEVQQRIDGPNIVRRSRDLPYSSIFIRNLLIHIESFFHV
jgi:hypothetical protein